MASAAPSWDNATGLDPTLPRGVLTATLPDPGLIKALSPIKRADDPGNPDRGA
jgi:hypothetical protein